MDDIRRPQHLKRRDYSIPTERPPAAPPLPNPQPAHTRTPHHAPAQPPTPNVHPHYHPAQVEYQQPQPSAEHNHTHPKAAAPARKKRRLSAKIITITAGILLAALAIFGAGYLLKGSSDSNTIPATITRQVNYDLYFPSPMPGGYTYMKDTATFQIGQVYYKFANGKKRVTVNEQPLPETKPDLNLLAGYTQFDSPAGKAAIGMDLGEPAAVVVTPTTVITMHCVGGVSKDDLKTAINNLKNIGQKADQ
jgi:hypothetical protein